MHREMGQPAAVEALLPPTLGQNQRLARIAAAVDWAPIGQVVVTIYAAPVGWPSYPPLLLVKALLLAQWYALSAPQLEAALSDRRSFRRFVGLRLHDDTPDHSTISRFRRVLAQRELSVALFAAVPHQLAQRGLVLKQGTLLDATGVAAQVRRPPRSAGNGAKSATDPDADWTYSGRGARPHFGYKVHLGVDQGSLLVRRAVLTPAKVYESEVADALVCGDEGAVYGDRAYESKARRQRLKAAGIKDRIMHRSHKHPRELPPWQQRHNELIGPIRAQVEKVFGTLKRTYRYQRVRYRGLARNGVELWFKLLAYNLRKAGQLLLNTA